MLKKKYDIVFSLGSSCACAMYMKKANIRSFASPFDWLTNVDFETRLLLMLRDFENFMNQDDFRLLPPDTTRTIPRDFLDLENIRTGFYFYHDFPRHCSWTKSFPLVREKYIRRIERFYNLTKKHHSVLMIWFSHCWQTDDTKILDLWKQFCDKMGKKIDLLVIENCPDLKYGEIYKYSIDENIVRYQLHTEKKDLNGEKNTLGDSEHCLPIFQQFSLHISFRRFYEKMVCFLVCRIFCLFLPVKAWRKQIRKNFKEK